MVQTVATHEPTNPFEEPFINDSLKSSENYAIYLRGVLSQAWHAPIIPFFKTMYECSSGV